MSNFMEIIKERRSIRKFEDKDIAEADIKKILDLVSWSPSWANTQCWEIIVVKDSEIKEKLKSAIAPKNPATEAVKAAPVVFALCAKLKSAGYYNGVVTTKFGDWFMHDIGIAAQTLVLSAHHLGLSSVIVGLFDHNAASLILEVPEGYELVSLIPVGYPDQSPKPPKRKDISQFTHYDKW